MTFLRHNPIKKIGYGHKQFIEVAFSIIFQLLMVT